MEPWLVVVLVVVALLAVAAIVTIYLQFRHLRQCREDLKKAQDLDQRYNPLS